MSDRKFKKGDRVKRSDAEKPTAIPAYANMRGEVVGFDWTRVLVRWDCDPSHIPPTPHMPEDIALASRCDQVVPSDYKQTKDKIA